MSDSLATLTRGYIRGSKITWRLLSPPSADHQGGPRCCAAMIGFSKSQKWFWRSSERSPHRDLVQRTWAASHSEWSIGTPIPGIAWFDPNQWDRTLHTTYLWDENNFENSCLVLDIIFYYNLHVLLLSILRKMLLDSPRRGCKTMKEMERRERYRKRTGNQK